MEDDQLISSGFVGLRKLLSNRVKVVPWLFSDTVGVNSVLLSVIYILTGFWCYSTNIVTVSQLLSMGSVLPIQDRTIIN